uniref:Uncharacterized protein n=1 Tax=Grammatophora oceanica TaxID=210454 RepID=A0A7S1YK87_9STRA
MEEDTSNDDFDEATVRHLRNIDSYGLGDFDSSDDDEFDDMQIDADDETKPGNSLFAFDFRKMFFVQSMATSNPFIYQGQQTHRPSDDRPSDGSIWESTCPCYR